MHLSHSPFRRYTGDAEGPRNVLDRGATSLGFYHDVPLTGDLLPRAEALDATFENEWGSATGNSPPSPTKHRNSSEEFSSTKINAEEKGRRFPRFNLSLTARPPKTKPKHPGQSPPPMVRRAGGRGGVGNIKPLAQGRPVASGSPPDQKSKIPTANSRARPSLPEGEATNSEYGSPFMSPEGREMAIPRMKPATSGRGGAGNLHHHVLEDGVFERVIAHEDVLIRQRQADKIAHRTGRGGVGNIKRSDGDPDLEHSTSFQSGSSGSPNFRSRGRATSTSTKSSRTTSSSGASIDIQTDTAIHPNFQPLAPLPNEAHEPKSSVLEQGDTDGPVARDGDECLRIASPVRKMNAVYAVLPGVTTSNVRPKETSGRVGPRSPSPSRLDSPHDHPFRSHERGDHGGRQFFLTNPDILDSRTAPRPQDAPGLDGLGDHPDARIPRANPPTRALLSSTGPYLLHPIHPVSSQRRFEESVYPTIVPPPITSMETPPGMPSGGYKEYKHYVANGSHLEDHRGSDIGRMRESGAHKDQRLYPEYVSKAQEEGWDVSYSDLFERRIATISETDSATRSGAGTPLSDQSAVLAPSRASPGALSSMAKKTPNRPTNPQLAGIPHIPSTKPTSRPRSPAEEKNLHCDELNLLLHKPLSRMEKAILRRIEFGQNADFSRIQLS